MGTTVAMICGISGGLNIITIFLLYNMKKMLKEQE